MPLNEIDASRLAESFPFCVYLHKKPGGEVFYVGKGIKRRAYDLSPSRRNAWHRSVVAKHGASNIGIEVTACSSEPEALLLERVQIAIHRADGAPLVNLTDGGEGASGHVANAAQLEALAKGRVKGKKGVKGPRPQLEAWIKSPAGQAHVRVLAEKAKVALHAPRKLVCAECGLGVITRSAKAKCCSRRCEQRYRRAGKNAK